MKVQVQVGAEQKEIEILQQGDTLRILMDQRELDVRVIYSEGAHFVLEYDEPHGDYVRRRCLRAAGYADGDQRQLWVNGSLVNYSRVREHGGAAAQAGAGSLSASIPAVVSEVLVHRGDTVRAGQKLILLESMKMIIPIVAPYDGVVEAVNCSPGESVQPGVELVQVAEAN